MHPHALPAQRRLSAVLATAVPVAGWAATTAVMARRLDAARRDPLTGLHTRDAFTARATRLTAAHRALVLLVDLDGFKALNDRHGHPAGDAVLARTGRRLAEDTTAASGRLGGDEFAHVVRLTVAPPEHEAEALHAHLTRTVPWAGHLLCVGASIGACPTTPGVPLADALTAADAAMYQAKRNGGGWRIAAAPLPTASAAPRRWRRHRPATADRSAA